GATNRHMFWSQPKPWAKIIGVAPLPDTLTLCFSIAPIRQLVPPTLRLCNCVRLPVTIVGKYTGCARMIQHQRARNQPTVISRVRRGVLPELTAVALGG